MKITADSCRMTLMRYRNGRQLGGWSLATLSVRRCRSHSLKPRYNILPAWNSERLNGVCASTTTHLASPTCLKTWDGISQSNVGLTVGSWPSLRSPWGSSLITLTGYCAMSCTEHVSRTRKVSSGFKLACPLNIHPFFSKTVIQ